MGTISERVLRTGVTKYRAQVRVKRKDLPNFTESKTFSKRSLAEAWVKKREYELEINPELLNAVEKPKEITLNEALTKYLFEVKNFERSKRMGIRFLTDWPIAKIKLSQLSRKDFAEHTQLRLNGVPDRNIDPICSSTALQELQYLKSVLNHADLVWEYKVNIFELEQAMKGLRNARLITKSKKRDVLYSSKQLQDLTNYFYKRWELGRTQIPVHLIIWFAIYSGRRQAEISRLKISDFNRKRNLWKIADLKNPKGSAGNDKSFIVNEKCIEVITELLKPDVRSRMLKLGGDPNILIPLDPKSFATRWREGIKMCDLDGMRFHDLRHESLTRYAEDGLTIPQLQQISMHESWESLRRYVNFQHREERLDFTEAMLNARKAFKK